MNIFWLGDCPPPEDVEMNVVDSFDAVSEDALVFTDDPGRVRWDALRGQRVYLVSHLPVSHALPEGIAGVIPDDAVVIEAIATLYSEMRESYDLGDRFMRTLDEKERAIAEQHRTLVRDSKRYNAIIRNATDLIFLLGPTGRIMFCNETFGDYVGEDASISLIGRSFVDYVSDDDKESLLEIVRKGFRTGLPAKTEARLDLAGGRTGTFSLMSTPLVEEGHIYALSVIGRDITDIRSMQHRLSLQARDLTLMMNGLSHELRNPLTVIGAYMKRIEKEDGDQISSRRSTALTGIHASIKRIEDMILRIEQYEAMVNMTTSYAEVDLAQLIRDVLSTVRSSVPVIIDAGDNIIALSDADHIRCAFVRIFENAVETGTSEIRIEISRDRSHGVIRVRDYGPGITDDVETIFAPLYSTDPMKTGLGLTEARIAMAKIGSTIEVIPQANPGAVVTLRILLDRRRSARERPLAEEDTGVEV